MHDVIDPPRSQVTSAVAPTPISSSRALAWIFVVGGGIGLLAAVVLLVEKISLIEDPDYIPSCSINPILSCGSIMRTGQAEAFGFPNPIIGVAGFAIVATIGMAMLAGASFRRWFWIGLQAGTTFGVAFVHWLIFQSLYRIGALCPYCMVVWVVTIALFWYTTLHNARSLSSPAARRAVAAAASYHGVVLTAWYLAIAALVGARFWDYWSTLLS
jgi:uncharacterized membrane protein